MTKSEIVEHLARQSGLRKREVQLVVDSFIDSIKKGVQDGEKVEIRGFGSFCQVEKKARNVFSPIAGKNIEVPAKITIGFKASKATEMELDIEGV